MTLYNHFIRGGPEYVIMGSQILVKISWMRLSLHTPKTYWLISSLSVLNYGKDHDFVHVNYRYLRLKLLTEYCQLSSGWKFGAKLVYYSTTETTIQSCHVRNFKNFVVIIQILVDDVIFFKPERKRNIITLATFSSTTLYFSLCSLY